MKGRKATGVTMAAANEEAAWAAYRALRWPTGLGESASALPGRPTALLTHHHRTTIITDIPIVVVGCAILPFFDAFP